MPMRIPATIAEINPSHSGNPKIIEQDQRVKIAVKILGLEPPEKHFNHVWPYLAYVSSDVDLGLPFPFKIDGPSGYVFHPQVCHIEFPQREFFQCAQASPRHRIARRDRCKRVQPSCTGGFVAGRGVCRQSGDGRS